MFLPLTHHLVTVCFGLVQHFYRPDCLCLPLSLAVSFFALSLLSFIVFLSPSRRPFQSLFLSLVSCVLCIPLTFPLDSTDAEKSFRASCIPFSPLPIPLYHFHPPNSARDAAKCLKRKLSPKSQPATVVKAIAVLETAAKNCGKRFHIQVTTKDFCSSLAKLVDHKVRGGRGCRSHGPFIPMRWAAPGHNVKGGEE